MIFVMFITLYPFYHIAIVSISDPAYVIKNEISFIPRGVNFISYKSALMNPILLRSLKNTIIYTFLGTFVNLFFTIMCAYPLSRKSFSGRKFFTIIIVFTMFFSGGLIPGYLLVRSLGMIDTISAIVLTDAIQTFYLIIMRTFFSRGYPIH